MSGFQPLRGARVLSFETAFSLPSGTRTLAELGAEVVRVGRLDHSTSDYINYVDGNAFSKLSLALNLQHAEGQALARRLVERADVVCNNFRPRVLERFGLGEADLRALKPGLITLQLSGYSATGGWRDYPAYGPSVEAAGGMNALSGGEDDPPVRVGSGVFADQASGRYAALALIAALERRQRTGEGQSIDLSMYESIVHLLGDAIVSTAKRAASPARRGNRDALYAPQGIYPCQGADEWLAVTVKTDAQWRAFRDLLTEVYPEEREAGAEGASPCGVSAENASTARFALPTDDPRTALGAADDSGPCSLLQDPELDRAPGRRRRHDELDALIGSWTRRLEKNEAAALLQARGIPAGPVQKPGDLPFDPHLAARGAFSQVQHARPMLGATAHPHLTTPWQAAGRARHTLRDAPGDGAENARVLRRWLGLRAGEVARLERDGVLAPFRPFQLVPPTPATGAPVDPVFAARLGLPRAADGSS